MNKREMVQLIKKVALEEPPLPGATPAAPIGEAPIPATPSTEGGVGRRTPVTTPVNPAQTPVGKMQAALMNLAREVTKEMGTSSLQMAPGQTEATPEQKEAGGRTSFSDFVAQHYMRHSDVPGIEYSPDPKRTQQGQKDPTQTTRMNVVMDTMRRIGTPDPKDPQGEFKVDGNWGWRTNTGLHNAYAYAYSLLKMAKDYDYQPQEFNEGSLQQFQQLLQHVPVGKEKSVSEPEKERLATDIFPFLRGITHLFGEIKRHILQKPAYRSFIEGSQAYVTYPGTSSQDPKKVADLNSKFTHMRITQPAQPGMSQVVRLINVQDLTSLQALQTWQKTNMPNMPLPNILQQIKKHLDDTDVSRG